MQVLFPFIWGDFVKYLKLFIDIYVTLQGMMAYT